MNTEQNQKTLYVTKANGTKEMFDEHKLEHSLKRAGAGSKEVTTILQIIKQSITPTTTTHDIYNHAFQILKKEGSPSLTRYSLKRAIMDLGPSGFPFEDFVAEIFKSKGFETLTGQTVKGFCVEHEIDVVAWNKEKLIMVEAKFHNELGVKSDLKVALYVKARFEDLSKVTFNYGFERKLDEGWLVTNTKFTTTAIEYGMCQANMHMVGWNYPPNGNLHDMILQEKLHPLTCLSSLSGSAKKMLLQKGVVLCKTLIDNQDLFEVVSLTDEEKMKVIEEIKSL